MKFILLLTVLMLSLNVFSQNYDCNNLPKKFNTYNTALNIIKSSKFSYTDFSDSFNSSWIKSISYYSCDKKIGYLIVIARNGKSYIHQSVPFKLWEGLKLSKSKGSYYSTNLRGNYNLCLF